MKKIWFMFLAACPGLVFCAQTNVLRSAPRSTPPLRTPPTLVTNKPPVEPSFTEIFSDRADFDLKLKNAIYQGHVRVNDPKMKLLCERLTAQVPESGGRMDHIVAETNVVIDFLDEKGQTNHASGDKAVYTWSTTNSITNEVVVLTGNPKLENIQGTLTGDVMTWDRINNTLRATNQKMKIRQTGTNSFNLFGQPDQPKKTTPARPIN